MVLKSIGVFSCGKLLGVMYTAAGLLVGGFMALASMAGAAGQVQGPNGNDAAFVFGMGIGALIFVPVLYGLLGFIGGIIMSLMYNLFAELIGGIELNLEQRQDYGNDFALDR